MIIGVPKETKQDEYRVGMIPVGAEELTKAGHRVVMQAEAGLGSGITGRFCPFISRMRQFRYV